MSERILAEGAIEVGHHTTAHWLGMTVNTDTVLATAIAAATRATRRTDAARSRSIRGW